MRVGEAAFLGKKRKKIALLWCRSFGKSIWLQLPRNGKCAIALPVKNLPVW
jgi:hypothetical protein